MVIYMPILSSYIKLSFYACPCRDEGNPTYAVFNIILSIVDFDDFTSQKTYKKSQESFLKQNV